jgi:hypothetical protein
MSSRNGMVLTMLAPFVMATREFAMQMLANALYILGELPDVKMSDGLRARTREVCNSLISTKHDLITELFDLDDLAASDATDPQLGERVERIVRWAREDLLKLHELVTALDAASKQDTTIALASVLVTESATNILNFFDPMRRAAEGMLRAVQGVRLPGESPS